MNRWVLEQVSTHLGAFDLGPIDLAVEAGDIVAVLGRSGAGKTTLLRCVAGLLPVRSGAIRVDGERVERVPPEERHVGYVPQGLGLLPHLSVRENVGYSERLRGERRSGLVEEMLERFRLTELSARKPGALSAGERQRVALARTLVARSRLLLWDEPLSAIDVASRVELIQVLRTAARDEGLPVLVVTHDPAVAFSLTDRLFALDRGRASFTGRVDALLDQPSDAFLARFAGFDNIVDRPSLEDRELRGIFESLRVRAGPAGVGFPSSAVELTSASGSGISGRVEQLVRFPSGWRASVRLGRLLLEARSDRIEEQPPPKPGDEVGVHVHLAAVRPLGGKDTEVTAGS